MPLRFELVTPERVVFRTDVDQATLPTTQGEMTILQNHIPLVATLVPGIVRLHKGGVEEEVAVSGGAIQVLPGNKISVLADAAERGNDLDIAVIEDAVRRAEQLMREKVVQDDNAYAAAAAALERELSRARVARRHHVKHGIPLIEQAILSPDESDTKLS